MFKEKMVLLDKTVGTKHSQYILICSFRPRKKAKGFSWVTVAEGQKQALTAAAKTIGPFQGV